MLMGTPQGSREGLGAMVLGALVAVLTYPAVHLLHLPVPRFLPLEGRFSVAPPDGAISMGYYGALGAALVAGIVAWGVASRVQPLRRARDARRPALGRLRAAGAGLAMAAAFVREMVRWGG